MSIAPKTLDYYRNNRERFLEGLKDLLRIPSISALPEHQLDMRRAADFLAHELREMGIENVRLVEGDGHPLLLGERNDAPGKPTLAIYGHYDVQPPDPLEEWTTPPFEPTRRGEDLYARGAVDDKGQTYLILKAIQGHLETAGKLPVNVRFLIEGEEETDGGMLTRYLEEHGGEIGADAALICDTEMFAPGLPTITTGLRGLVYAEIAVQGAKTDLHSGMYGGVAPNPLMALAEILTGLKDADGRILIPGFYDDIEPPSPAEAEAWARLPFDEAKFLENEVGSTQLTGEPGYGTLERIWARPTLEVHGIRGGFVGEGAKTVIPSKALAKVSMRLVPDMDPEKAAQGLIDRVAAVCPRGVVGRTCIMAQAPASLSRTDNVYIEKAAAALEETFSTPVVYMRSGGSIPVVGLLEQHAGIPSVLMGFGLPDDNLHAPNEKFHIPNFYAGIEAVGRYLAKLSEAT